MTRGGLQQSRWAAQAFRAPRRRLRPRSDNRGRSALLARQTWALFDWLSQPDGKLPRAMAGEARRVSRPFVPRLRTRVRCVRPTVESFVQVVPPAHAQARTEPRRGSRTSFRPSATREDHHPEAAVPGRALCRRRPVAPQTGGRAIANGFSSALSAGSR